MRDSRKYSAYPSDLNVLESFQKLQDYLAKCHFKEDKNNLCPNKHFSLELGETRTLEARNNKEFMELLRQFPRSMPISFHGHFVNNKKEETACIIGIRQSGLSIIIESDDLNIISAFHERLKEFFQASNPLENQQKPVSRYGLKKTIFLAHRFDDRGKAVSSRLNEFLNRLGFHVLEGTGYEARDIPDKVMDKIKSQDIFICLATDGDLSWILSEAATAQALAKYIIILCEKGIDFNKGIIGKDYEYLEFPNDSIEKIFSDLLYALPS